MLMKTRSPAVALLAVALLVLSGCSAYHRARTRVPAGTEATLALRLTEAQAAEREAVRVAGLVLDAMHQDPSAVAVRMDQLEVAAADLSRNLFAVHDAAALAAVPDERELTRLEASSRQLQSVVAKGRSEGERTMREALNSWIEHSAAVARGP